MVVKWPFMSQKFSLFFLTKLKKTETKNNFDLSCSFDPIKIRTRLAPQNVHQNLSFVKDIYVVCKKMTRNWRKILPKPICALHFRYVFIWHPFWRRPLRPCEVKKVSNDGSSINFHYLGSPWAWVFGRFIRTSGQARSLLCVKT